MVQKGRERERKERRSEEWAGQARGTVKIRLVFKKQRNKTKEGRTGKAEEHREDGERKERKACVTPEEEREREKDGEEPVDERQDRRPLCAFPPAKVSRLLRSVCVCVCHTPYPLHTHTQNDTKMTTGVKNAPARGRPARPPPDIGWSSIELF